MAQEVKKLYRSRKDKIIAGVAGGLGEYFEVDSILFRIIFLILALANGIGILLYIILMILIPREGSDPSSPGASERIQNLAEEIKDDLRQAAPEHGHRHRGRHGLSVIGAVLVIVGVLALLNQVLPVRLFRWDFFWPIALVVLGLIVISRGAHRHHDDH